MAGLWAVNLVLFYLFSLPLLTQIKGNILREAFSFVGYDGLGRVKQGCPSPRGVLSQEGTSVLYFTDGPGDKNKLEITKKASDKRMLEETAQALESREIGIVMVSLKSCKHFQKDPDFTPRSIHAFHNGHRFRYLGIHSSHALIPFILKVQSPVVNHIDSKAHKKAFDKVDSPKLVALLQPNTPQFKEFEKVAQTVHPYISCHTVSDARSLKDLNHADDGTVLYYAPYREDPEPVFGNGTSVEILDYLRSHEDSFFRQVHPLEFYSVMDVSEKSKRLVIALIHPKTPEGHSLYKALKHIANDGATRRLDLNIIYFNLDNYHIHLSTFEKQFNSNFVSSMVGLVNLTSGNAEWFNTVNFHKRHKEEQTDILSAWLKQLTSDFIRVDGEPANVPTDEPPDVLRDDHLETEVSDDAEEVETEKNHELKKYREEENSKKGEDEMEINDENRGNLAHSGKQRSEYMKKFDKGEKIFSKLFSYLGKPLKSVWGSHKLESTSTEHTKDKSEVKDDEEKQKPTKKRKEKVKATKGASKKKKVPTATLR